MSRKMQCKLYTFVLRCVKKIPQFKIQSIVSPRIVQILTVRFHYSAVNFLVQKHSMLEWNNAIYRNSVIFGSGHSIDSNSAVLNNAMNFLDKNACYARTYCISMYCLCYSYVAHNIGYVQLFSANNIGNLNLKKIRNWDNRITYHQSVPKIHFLMPKNCNQTSRSFR